MDIGPTVSRLDTFPIQTEFLKRIKPLKTNFGFQTGLSSLTEKPAISLPVLGSNFYHDRLNTTLEGAFFGIPGFLIGFGTLGGGDKLSRRMYGLGAALAGITLLEGYRTYQRGDHKEAFMKVGRELGGIFGGFASSRFKLGKLGCVGAMGGVGLFGGTGANVGEGLGMGAYHLLKANNVIS